ncbi:MAG: hypothetical protein ACRDK9_14725 [Solirubrobacterales bacterium]
MGPSPLAIAAVALALVATGGCGEDEPDEPETLGVGRVTAGSVAQLAECSDWNRGTEEQRLATIEEIRDHINLEDAPVETTPLSDERAYEVFENACEPPVAAGFRLFKLYARAVAFEPLLGSSPTP